MNDGRLVDILVWSNSNYSSKLIYKFDGYLWPWPARIGGNAVWYFDNQC